MRVLRGGLRWRSLLWRRRRSQQDTEPAGEAGRTWKQAHGYGERVPEGQEEAEEEAEQADHMEGRDG